MAPYEVKVLKDGYAIPAGTGMQRADGTITLVAGRHKVLVDTGGPWDTEAILRGLQAEQLSPADIDHVVCTHGHSDHVGNIGLFPHATLIVSYDISSGDLYTSHPFARGERYRIDDDVEVIATPGHTSQDVSVVVRTPAGIHVIAGDLFESEEDLTDEDIWRASSEDPARQAESRERILRLADFIVPGHGSMFAVRGRDEAPGKA
jgi:glyoxylase-like metal-dependent hydrolase (beta-lactamase superfamily II)